MQKTLVQRVVSVTPELIARGKPLSETRCPVALALRRIDPTAEVNQLVTSLRVGDRPLLFKHDEALATWIFNFDFAQPVEPIDIAIDIENRRLWIA